MISSVSLPVSLSVAYRRFRFETPYFTAIIKRQPLAQPSHYVAFAAHQLTSNHTSFNDEPRFRRRRAPPEITTE